MIKIAIVVLSFSFSLICGLIVVFAAEINDNIPELYIKAINPGYSIDGKNNVGELIEISRRSSDDMISLAGITIGYTNSSGSDSTLFEFPENSFLTGESILLRLASSPDSELAATNYTKTLAFKAGLSLKKNDEILDEVCWTGKADCYKEFKSSNPTFLVRNLETGEFEHLKEYEVNYDEKAYLVKNSDEGEIELPSQCKNLQFSEILSYYETTKTEQFVEFYNSGFEQILLDGCKLRYKNKNYDLTGIVKPEEYIVYYPRDFNLTKDPASSNTLEIVDTNEKTVDKLVYFNGQRKGTAFALIGYDEKGEEIWKTTYAPTPGAGNVYQEFRTCEAGKVINEETGNCVKVTSIAEKVCAPGQYLNILTGRCKKIEEQTIKECKEGYYLNPETNRCRKIKENNGVNYSLKPEEYKEESSFIALYIVIFIVLVALGYLIYEFRNEILKFWQKVFRRFR
ncbi:hypothetical protein IKD82_01915 [Candidatus Saccharibacteria bacterium]|nr:hypothetical protein [Candidatus Saccharibacteria bacterium]